MENLHEILKKENYKKIKFKVTKTQHLQIKAKINGVSGNFILDTGAEYSILTKKEIADFLNIDYQRNHIVRLCEYLNRKNQNF